MSRSRSALGFDAGVGIASWHVPAARRAAAASPLADRELARAGPRVSPGRGRPGHTCCAASCPVGRRRRTHHALTSCQQAHPYRTSRAEWHAPKCGAGPRDHPGAPTPTPAWRHPCLPRSSGRTPAPGRPLLTSPRAGTRRAPSGSHAHPRGGSPRPGPWLAPCRLQKRRGVPFSLSYLSMKRDLLVRAD